MSKKTFANSFAKFASASNITATIPSLGQEVTFRKLTMDESDGFNARLVTGYDGDGKAQFDYAAATEIKYEKVAMCLIEPKVTVADLKSLDAGGLEAITEINTLIDGGVIETEDEAEGND